MTTYNDTLEETLSADSSYSSLADINNTLSEILNKTDSSFASYPIRNIMESLSYNSPPLIIAEGIAVLDDLLINGLGISSIKTTSSILELIRVFEDLKLTFNSEVIDSMTLQDLVVPLLNNIQEVAEVLSVSGASSAKVSFINTLSELIKLLDSASHGFNRSITEEIVLTGTILEIYTAIAKLTESLLLTLEGIDSYVNIVVLTDSMNLLEEVRSKSVFKSLLSDNIFIRIPVASGQDSYLGYTFAPENSVVTTYSNYNFDGAAKVDHRYYFFNKEGLYRYGDNTDDGDAIRSIITTAALSFGTSNKKTIPQVYLGATNSDELLMKVRLDGKAECHYKLRKYTNELDTQKIKIGKGLIGRYFQFELITEAEDFDMESIEFFPLVLKRKL